MTEPDYKQILKNQDIINQLSLEEVKNLQRLLNNREFQIKGKTPEFHILDNPDNIKISKNTIVDDNFIPRVEYIISVNKEAVLDHKNLWRQWYIDNVYRTQEDVDDYMDTLIHSWIVEKLYECFDEND